MSLDIRGLMAASTSSSPPPKPIESSGRVSPRKIKHWFLDRWCAELAVEDLLNTGYVAERLGVSREFVHQAVIRVYGCRILEARRKDMEERGRV